MLDFLSANARGVILATKVGIAGHTIVIDGKFKLRRFAVSSYKLPLGVGL